MAHFRAHQRTRATPFLPSISPREAFHSVHSASQRCLPRQNWYMGLATLLLVLAFFRSVNVTRDHSTISGYGPHTLKRSYARSETPKKPSRFWERHSRTARNVALRRLKSRREGARVQPSLAEVHHKVKGEDCSEDRPPLQPMPERRREHVMETFLERFHRRGGCYRGWQSVECYDDVVRLALRRQKNGTIVIVVVAHGSYDLILNWCVSMKNLKLSNYVLVALDIEAFDFFSRAKAPVTLLCEGNNTSVVSKNDMWIRRTFAAYMVLNGGVNVLVSDADAIMMKSPFGNARSHFGDESISMISSPSNFPNENKNELPAACTDQNSGAMKWRHQPCMGWIFLRSTAAMIDFFVNRLLPDVLQYRDDQIGFNCAVRRAGAVWNDGDFWTSDEPMLTQLESPQMKLLVLPGSEYVRNCTRFFEDKERGYGIYKFKHTKVQMYHCKGSNKKANAENNRAWFLSKDWNATVLRPELSYKQYLSSITDATSTAT